MIVSFTTLRPFGRVSLNIWGAITDDVTRVFCEVQSNPFVPLVSANTNEARQFAEAIIQACDSAERAARTLREPPENPAGFP